VFRILVRVLGVAAVSATLLATLSVAPLVAQSGEADARVGLKAGWLDAATAEWNMRLVSTTARPEGFFRPGSPGDFGTANSDLAFQGTLLFQGNFNGFQIWDVADPTKPALKLGFVCKGGQGDVSVFGTLLFLSVEETSGRLDCGTQGAPGQVNPDRFRGVRIFDISDLSRPVPVTQVQTCRGSHTHTLVSDPKDSTRIYVYVSGTSFVRSNNELAGCSAGRPDEDPTTSFFQIEVIEVPLANPRGARIVNTPRVFADRETGAIAGLWPGGAHGEGKQRTARTDQCHDITAYPEIGLAAGACSGNGILLDITNPANPVRIDEVIDENFAYWHSATFNNDGRTVLFTDEWGGGTAPRCRVTDKAEWGANAIFTLRDRKLSFASHYKLPAAQTATENCVAHNGSLVPVPGRDIKVQAWYQGGVSVFDFTDPAKPTEIAYFDRGPISDSVLVLGGQWSTYWYNGLIYGSEIARGLDVMELLPSEHLTANELAAAKLVQVAEFNPQHQERITWPAEVVVAKAYLDQLTRASNVPTRQVTALRRQVEQAERATGTRRGSTLEAAAAEAQRMAGAASGKDAERLQGIASTLRAVAAR
jgi:hypothetical protein